MKWKFKTLIKFLAMALCSASAWARRTSTPGAVRRSSRAAHADSHPTLYSGPEATSRHLLANLAHHPGASALARMPYAYPEEDPNDPDW